MVLHDIPYYSVNRFFGLLVGVWPGKAGMYTYVQKFFIVTCFFSGIFIQLGVFITHEFSYILCIRIIVGTTSVLVYLIKYLTTMIYSDKLMQILNWIQDDWNTYSTKEEQMIIAKHAKNGRTITILCATLLWNLFGVFMIEPHVPRILDIVIPLNKTRSAKLPIPLEYFVDSDKYFYLILLHIDLFTFWGVCVIIATEGFSILIVEHICGLFSLVSYHLQIAVKDTALHFKEYILIREKVKTVVQVHCRAFDFVNILNTSIMNHYILMIILGVLSLAGNLYICSQALLHTGNLEELFVSAILIFVLLSYTFFCCYIGQILLNQCDQVFVKAYDTVWYSAPLPIQKCLLLLMQRGMKSCTLDAICLAQSSFVLFSGILKTSVSYFMMLWSLS